MGGARKVIGKNEKTIRKGKMRKMQNEREKGWKVMRKRLKDRKKECRAMGKVLDDMGIL